MTPEVQELVDCLREARTEMKCLGRDLAEINTGQRVRPTCLLNPEIIERIDEALEPFVKNPVNRKGKK